MLTGIYRHVERIYRPRSFARATHMPTRQHGAEEKIDTQNEDKMNVTWWDLIACPFQALPSLVTQSSQLEMQLNFTGAFGHGSCAHCSRPLSLNSRLLVVLVWVIIDSGIDAACMDTCMRCGSSSPRLCVETECSRLPHRLGSVGAPLLPFRLSARVADPSGVSPCIYIRHPPVHVVGQHLMAYMTLK